jgi:PAS domain S-box-containing protein
MSTPNPGSIPEQRSAAHLSLDAEGAHRTLFERISLGCAHCRMLYLDGQPVDWLYLEVNPAFAAVTGLGNPTGRKVSEVIPSLLQEAPQLFATCAEVARGGAPQRFEIHVASMNIWFAVEIFGAGPDAFLALLENITAAKQAAWRDLPVAAGQARDLMAMVRDLDQQRSAQDRVRQIMRDQEVILAHANVGISLIVDRCQVWINGWMEETFQYTLAEMKGRTTRMLYPSQEAYEAVGREAYPILVRGENYSGVHRLLRKDGQPLWISYNGLAIDPSNPNLGVLWVLNDVTSHKAAEDALRESEERYRGLFELSPDAICLTRLSDQTFQEVNPAWEQLSGYTRREALGRTSLELGLHVDPEQRSLTIRELAAPEGTNTGRTLLRRKDGTTFPATFTSRVIAMEGEPVAMVVARDITTQEANQRNTEEALGRLQSIASRVPGLVCQFRQRVDGSSHFPFASGGIREIYRLSPEEVREDAAPAFAVLHPEDLPGVVASIQASARALTPWNHEYRVRFQDGTVRILFGRAVPQREPDGSVLWDGFITDLTDLKLTEAALRESESRFRAMFERNQVPKLLIDPEEGRILDANPAAAAFYGYSLDQLRKLPIWALNDQPEADVRVHMARAMSGELGHFAFRHRLADGRLRQMDVSSSPIPMGNSTVLYSIVHDVTDRMEAEDSLRHLNQTLELRVASELARRLDHERALVHQSRQAAMGEMVGNIAHQWRQPLNALAMMLGGLKDAHRFGELTDTALDASLAQGHELIQKMSSTITDFMDFFRPGKAPCRFSLAQQARDAVQLVQSSLHRQGVSVAIEAAEDVWVVGHPNECSQVLLNLLANARDAIVAQGAVPGTVRIEIARAGDQARLRFSDNGGGIRVEPIERIFEPYFTDKLQGTGLGLYMSRMILEQSLGGTIHACNLDGGAAFTILLPLAEAGHALT